MSRNTESNEGVIDVQKRLDMELPEKSRPTEKEDTFAMIDRVQEWEKDFIASAQKALREIFGYTTATVLDFECLIGRPGHDANDYELTVRVGGDDRDKRVGHEGVQTLKIVVRRAAPDSLQS